jgi:type II restriction/modification system DNA methylase subunit YeeA
MTGNFRCMDAILDLTDPANPKEPIWEKVDFIVGNPPFLGDKMMRRELGDDYVDKLRALYAGRIPGQSDLCCYWFEQARAQIAAGHCKRAGLLATQGIRGGANREVLKRIKESGDIFWAVSDRDWVLEGANVHVSLIGFDGRVETGKMLDGRPVAVINANLTAETDSASSHRLASNTAISFVGASMHGPFSITEEVATEMLRAPNPTGHPNSDAVRPWVNGLSITKREHPLWIVDFPPEFDAEHAALYEAPFEYVRRVVKPVRDTNRRAMRARNWWLLGDPQKSMRAAVRPLPRYLGTPRVSKHRIFVWFCPEVLPTDQVVVFANADDSFLGILQSRLHEVWALRQCTVLGGNTPRYGPSHCFETFPLPTMSPAQQSAICALASDLDSRRNNWLNPPEWTRQEILEFPGTVGGPWDRYIDPTTIVDRGEFKLGTVKYPRLIPRDADSAAKLAKRTLTNLCNQRPTWLADAHRRLDEAVLAAYGWPADLTDEQILERLLELNLRHSIA